MMMFCVSLPGSFGDWCDAVIWRLAQTVLGPVVSTAASTAEELASELIRTEGQHFYVGSRQPSRWLREKLMATNKNFVVAMDDPRSAASDLVIRHQLEPAEASRRVASSCALISRYIALPGALVVSSERDWPNAAATVAALAHHLGLPVGTADIEKIAADLEDTRSQPNDEPGAASPAQLPEHSLAVINGALAPYVEFFKGAALGQITWARDLFLEEHHQPAIHPIDISGKIRHLIYGPYIALPPGNWIAEMVLGFSEDAVGMSFQVDVWAGSQLSMASINPSAPGLARVKLSFALEESSDKMRPLARALMRRLPIVRGFLDSGSAAPAVTALPSSDLNDVTAPTGQYSPPAKYCKIATPEDIFYCFRLLLGRCPNPEEWPGHSSRAGEDIENVVSSYITSRELAERGFFTKTYQDNVELVHLPSFSLFASSDDLAVGKHVVVGHSYDP